MEEEADDAYARSEGSEALWCRCYGGFLVRRSGDGLIEAELGPTNCRFGGLCRDWNVSRQLTLDKRRLRVFGVSDLASQRFTIYRVVKAVLCLALELESPRSTQPLVDASFNVTLSRQYRRHTWNSINHPNHIVFVAVLRHLSCSSNNS
jgi:hypothetical protein